MGAHRLMCLVVSQHDWRYVNGGFCCVMYAHSVAARVNANIEQTLYWSTGRWLILAALAHDLTETDALTALTGDHTIPGYPANVGSGVVLAAYYVFA